MLHNRDLALFYADHDMKLAEALDLAQKEFEVRHDIYTWDALAWAFYKNGKYWKRPKRSRAMRPGTRDALLLFHAGMIAKGLGQHALAKESCRLHSTSIPSFHVIYAGVAAAATEAVARPACIDRESRTEPMFRKRFCSFFLLSLCLCLRPRSFAHPMGNFSVNHYSKISLDREGIRISYIIDLAEIPTYQELQQGNVTAECSISGSYAFCRLARRRNWGAASAWWSMASACPCACSPAR